MTDNTLKARVAKNDRQYIKGPGGAMNQVVGLLNNSYNPITNTAWVRARLCKLQKRCTRLAVTSDKVYQLLAHGRWFSPASSTTKTGHHAIAEILLKVALSTINQIIKSNETMHWPSEKGQKDKQLCTKHCTDRVTRIPSEKWPW
jgi:hypothetical protein